MKKSTKRNRKANTRAIRRTLACPRAFMDLGIMRLTPEMLVELGKSDEQPIDPRSESLRQQLSTIIQRNHVERRTSDETAGEIVRFLVRLPPRKLFLGICADPCSK